ncbi:efflux ABC transporter permease protein [Eubacterium sp. CAG:192]|nr:efflux ABC transporter permease protein [Eubacterium sp. CAG:192]
MIMHGNEKNEKKKSDKLVKEISKVVYANGNEINEYVPRYTNSAINFTGDDIGSDHSMMIVLLYILIIILAFVFAVTINHTIVNEATAIGTLRAMGYSKKQLVVHYMALPIIISLMAAIIGNVLGYTIFKNVAAEMYYGSYSLTKYKTIWNAEAFILTTVVPLIIMLVINFITLMSKLSISPLKFIRKDLTRKKNKKALKLPNFKFITRFRLRIILQNKGNYITLFVGILFANIMLLFGMMMHPLLTHYQNEIVDNMIAKNQYVLKNSVQVKNKDAEKYSLTSLQINRRSLSEDISLYGIEEDSKYFKKNVENGMYISDGLSEKYKINIEKNKNSISMVKILGYNNREVGKLYITATTWMVGLSIIISLILSTEIIDQIYFEMMKDYNGWLTLYLEQKTYVEMFIIGIVCYGIVAFFQFKKIKKIPMDNALKNVE